MGIRKRLVVPDTLLEGRSSMVGMRLRARQSVIAKREEARATSTAPAAAFTETGRIHTSNSVFSVFQKDLYAYVHTHTHAHTYVHTLHSGSKILS